ncbi:hypothetical protein QUB19_19170 [Microcoleus sp. B4-C5]
MKFTGLNKSDDRTFPEITYVRGASGELVPVLFAIACGCKQ